jgi:WD40 repeat protein
MSIKSLLIASLGVVLLHATSALSQMPDLNKAPSQTDKSGEGFPPAKFIRLGTTRFRHMEPVLSVAFSPNGKVLASSDESGVVHLWEADTGKPVLELPKNTGTLVLFTPDGKNLLCSGEKRLSLINAGTGEVVRTYRDTKRARNLSRDSEYISSAHFVALSPDDKMLAETDGSLIVLWDLATGKQLHRLKGDNWIGSVAFASDGKSVATGDNDRAAPNYSAEKKTTITFWDTSTGEQTHKITGANQWFTTALAFSPDGKYFASASPYEMVLWDAATRKKLAEFKTGSPSLGFTPDGKFLAAAVDVHFMYDAKGPIRVYDPAKRELVRTIGSHAIHVKCAAIAPDGMELATGGPEGTVRLWATKTGRELSTGEGHEAPVNSVACSPDGAFAATASGGDHAIRIWGTASGAQLGKLEIPCESRHTHWCPRTHGWNLAFAADSKTLMCDDRCYDVCRGSVINGVFGNLSVTVLAHSADGKLLAGIVSDREVSDYGTVSVWDRSTGRKVSKLKPPGLEPPCNTSITAAAFSPDGSELAVGVMNDVQNDVNRRNEEPKESLYIYGLVSGRLLHKFRPKNYDGPAYLLYSPDGHLLAIAPNSEEPVELWGVADEELHAQLKGEEFEARSWNRPMAFSPNGRFLASGGKDNRIVIWDVLSAKPVHRLRGHEKPVQALAFSPNGRQLLSGGMDTQAFLWNVAPSDQTTDLSDNDLERLWGELASDNAAIAYHAAWVLAESPDKTLTVFKEKLKPLPSPDLTRVPRLLADLDNEEFEVREAAFKELQALGPVIEGKLRQILYGKPTLEVRKRVEMLVSEIHHRPLPAAELRQIRALQVLEWIDMPAAMALLEPLAHGAPKLRITQDAEAALRTFSTRHSAPAKKPEKPPSTPAQAAEPRKLSGLKKEITSLAYTADGHLLAVGSADGTVRLFDAAGKELRTFSADDKAVFAVAFSPDGKTLATAGNDQAIHLWEAKTGESLSVLTGHTGSITSIAFAPDGKFLASGSLDTTVRLWDLSASKLWSKSEGSGARVISVAFSPDGTTVAAGRSDECVNTVGDASWTIYDPQQVQFWNAGSGQPQKAEPRQGNLVAYSPSGKNVATAALMSELLVGGVGGIRVRGKGNVIGGGQGEATIKGYSSISIRDRVSGQLRGHFGEVGVTFAFSPDDRYLATARGSDIHMGGKLLDAPWTIRYGGRLRLWEIASGQEVLAFPETFQPTVIAFSPDRRTLAAGMKDGGVFLCELAPANKEAPSDEFRRTDCDRLWDALAREDAGAAYRALWQLRAVGGKALPFLGDRLQPTPADDPTLVRLLVELNAETIAVREAAFKELERRGADAEPALCRALPEASSPALRARILELLNAPGIVQHSDATARLRAIAAIEGIDSTAARTLLAGLAKGSPLLAQTQAAREALERVKQRQRNRN